MANLSTINSFKSWFKLLIPTSILMFGLFWLDVATWQLSVVLLVILATYIYGRDRLWELLVLSVPLLAFGPSFIVHINERWVYDATLTELLLMLIAVVFLLKLIINGELGQLKLNFILWFFSAFIVWAFISVTKVQDFHNFVYQVRVLIFSFLAFVLSYHLFDTKKKFEYFYLGISGLALLLGIELIYRFFSMGLSSSFFIYRSYIMIPIGAIALAAAMEAMLLPLVLVNFLRHKKADFIMWFQGAALAMGGLGLFITLGKGAIIALGLAFIIILYKFKEGRILSVLLLTLFVAVALVFFSPSVEGFISRVSNVSHDKNVEFRLDEYRIAQKILADHWQTGVGLGQEPLYYERQFNFEYNQIVNNFLLQVVLDLGVVGLGIFLLILVCILATLWRLIKMTNQLTTDQPYIWWAVGTLASLVAVAFNASVEVTIFTIPYGMILWLIIGAIVGMEVQIKHSKTWIVSEDKT